MKTMGLENLIMIKKMREIY